MSPSKSSVIVTHARRVLCIILKYDTYFPPRVHPCCRRPLLQLHRPHVALGLLPLQTPTFFVTVFPSRLSWTLVDCQPYSLLAALATLLKMPVGTVLVTGYVALRPRANSKFRQLSQAAPVLSQAKRGWHVRGHVYNAHKRLTRSLLSF